MFLRLFSGSSDAGILFFFCKTYKTALINKGNPKKQLRL
jgi:hypothetical protein